MVGRPSMEWDEARAEQNKCGVVTLKRASYERLKSRHGKVIILLLLYIRASYANCGGPYSPVLKHSTVIVSLATWSQVSQAMDNQGSVTSVGSSAQSAA